MNYTIFPKKVILKWNKELVDLHKRVLKSYLFCKGISYSGRAKFFKLYDHYINEENIRDYYFTPLNIFIQGLVKNQLDKVSTYYQVKPPKKKNVRSKRKKSVH